MMRQDSSSCFVLLLLLLLATTFAAAAAAELPHYCREDSRWKEDDDACFRATDAVWQHTVTRRQPVAALHLHSNSRKNDDDDTTEPTAWRTNRPQKMKEIGDCFNAEFGYFLSRKREEEEEEEEEGKEEDKEEHEHKDKTDDDDDNLFVNSLLQHRHGTAAVTVPHALTEAEITALHTLAACARQHDPSVYERRVFTTADNQNTGNDVTFFQQYLHEFLPGIVHQLYQILACAVPRAEWEARLQHEWQTIRGSNTNDSSWTLLHSLGIRTTEHLNYQYFPGGLGIHEDYGSLFTILVVLSDPDEYQGGRFIVDLHDDEGPGHVTMKPPQATAVVFLSSETSHGVTPLTGGKRQTFATEFWVYPDTPFGFGRPDKMRWELFLKKISNDTNATAPTEEEVKEYWEGGSSAWADWYKDEGPYDVDNDTEDEEGEEEEEEEFDPEREEF